MGKTVCDEVHRVELWVCGCVRLVWESSLRVRVDACRGLRCWVVVVVCGGRGGADVLDDKKMVDDMTLQLYQFDCCTSAPHKKNAAIGGAWLEECGRWRYSHVPTSSGPFFSRLARLATIFFIDSFFAARCTEAQSRGKKT